MDMQDVNWSRMMLAAGTNDLTSLQRFIAEGDDVNEKNDGGWTALMSANACRA